MARDSAIIGFLRSNGRTGRAAALAALRRITTDTSSTASLELRDFNGKLLLRTGRNSSMARGSDWPSSSGSSSDMAAADGPKAR